MMGRTVIAIAHRLSTLRNFDRIIVMSAGKVIDDGSPGVLRERPGLYRDLLAKQHGRHLAAPAPAPAHDHSDDDDSSSDDERVA